jgi:ABC-type transport system involved in cytochrome c biogenesis permease subunit
MELLIGIIIGALGASIGWFFVWRNNKKKLASALAKADNLINVAKQ